MSRRFWVHLLITTPALLGILMINYGRESGLITAADSPPQQELHDYIIRGVSLQQTGDDGQLREQLSATTLTHYPTDDRSVLTQPHIRLVAPNSGSWELKADQATLLGRDQAELSGAVQIALESTSVTPYTLTTDYLALDLQQQLATSPSQVTILSDQLQLSAGAMILSLADNQLELTDGVHARYEP